MRTERLIWAMVALLAAVALVIASAVFGLGSAALQGLVPAL